MSIHLFASSFPTRRSVVLRAALVLLAVIVAAPLAGSPVLAQETSGSAASSSQAGSQTVAQGHFIERESKGEGVVFLVINEEGRWLEFNEDFKTGRAPDLRVYLSPVAASELTAETIEGGMSVFLAELDRRKGSQRYRIPENIDLTRFRSVAVHCLKYSKLYTAADLQKGQ
ncbi:MAG: hypothetical protein COV99_12065 [Bacteroidetes bacterium CG12_big_fil_rev_8_21_14_0_65_60_17]|nr:MAG: hypothetical protein COV99_12065 [Bacteroidetes bacterium CG12_big_fil_rev_8_21_14_0_65_60_17]